MKGVIFNIVEEIVIELYDADTWDALLDAANSDGVFTALGDYPSSELVAIVMAASEATGLAPADVLELVGRRAFPKLLERMPEASRPPLSDPFTFLRGVNDIIHPEVRKLYPDSVPPAFEFADVDGALQLTYRSKRGMQSLAEGLMYGVGDMHGVELSIERVGEVTDGSIYMIRVLQPAELESAAT
jgi:hypothetical protein